MEFIAEYFRSSANFHFDTNDLNVPADVSAPPIKTVKTDTEERE